MTLVLHNDAGLCLAVTWRSGLGDDGAGVLGPGERGAAVVPGVDEPFHGQRVGAPWHLPSWRTEPRPRRAAARTVSGDGLGGDGTRGGRPAASRAGSAGSAWGTVDPA